MPEKIGNIHIVTWINEVLQVDIYGDLCVIVSSSIFFKIRE